MVVIVVLLIAKVSSNSDIPRGQGLSCVELSYIILSCTLRSEELVQVESDLIVEQFRVRIVYLCGPALIDVVFPQITFTIENCRPSDAAFLSGKTRSHDFNDPSGGKVHI